MAIKKKHLNFSHEEDVVRIIEILKCAGLKYSIGEVLTGRCSDFKRDSEELNAKLKE